MEDYSNNILKININTMRSDYIPTFCGYCKEKNSCYKYYLNIETIPLNIFEDMFSKGWTRCGNRIYLSSYEKTCCKLYQPRLNINNFQISKEQKKIMKRFRKYLSGEYEENKIKKKEEKPKKIIIEDPFKNNISQKVNEYINGENCLKILKQNIKDENEIQIYLNKIKETKIRRITNKKYNFNYSCDLIFIIKKVFSSKSNKNNNNINQINNKEDNENDLKKLVNDLYNNFKENYKSREEIISFSEETGHINFQIKNQNEYQKYIDEESFKKTGNINNKINNLHINLENNNIINEKGDTINEKIKNEKNKEDKNIKDGDKEKEEIKNIKKKSNKNQKKDKQEKEIPKKQKYIFDYFQETVSEPEIYLPLKHTYSIELSKNIILEETEERFLLYRKYEQTIHKEKEVPVWDHNRSWGNSILEKNKKIPLPTNLKEKTPHPELYPEFYGTYNIIHRIDNKIVAVTVVDILPHYLISDYCYYDPDYSFLDLGVITAIREIEYMKSFNNLIDNNFIYYSMGELCQTCQKLKYKGNYRPIEIMDYYTGKYVYLTEEVKKIIEDNKCHFLSDNDQNSNVHYFSMFEIEDKFFNLMISVFGEKMFIDDFFNLYLEGQENVRKAIINNLKRFLEIIDKEIYSKIEFYFEITN